MKGLQGVVTALCLHMLPQKKQTASSWGTAAAGCAGLGGDGLTSLLHPLCAGRSQAFDTLLNLGQPRQALGYCSLAILARAAAAPVTCAVRATCLAELGV